MYYTSVRFVRLYLGDDFIQVLINNSVSTASDKPLGNILERCG